MAYDKILIAEDGEEFPYSEYLDSGGYHYRISIVWNERDGELVVLNEGAHIVFDDDESWLDFNIAPKYIFPGNTKLSEHELIEFMSVLSRNEDKAVSYSKEKIESAYRKYLQEKQKE
ncbi:MAG: hypothetical protein KJ826_03520 [Proteobacteria bacterium]|nr:hypothetical protein [Pseudomonadota bacterium]